MPNFSTKYVPRRIKAAIATAPASADSGILLAEMMRAWGGPVGVADALRSEFDSANPGTIARKGIMELLQRLVIENTKANIAHTRRPEEMEDWELDEIILKYMARLNNGEKDTGP